MDLKWSESAESRVGAQAAGGHEFAGSQSGQWAGGGFHPAAERSAREPSRAARLLATSKRRKSNRRRQSSRELAAPIQRQQVSMSRYKNLSKLSQFLLAALLLNYLKQSEQLAESGGSALRQAGQQWALAQPQQQQQQQQQAELVFGLARERRHWSPLEEPAEGGSTHLRAQLSRSPAPSASMRPLQLAGK